MKKQKYVDVPSL